ncbi:MAG: C-type lectin domain-containing protein [Limisphaerales bacterium]
MNIRTTLLLLFVFSSILHGYSAIIGGPVTNSANGHIYYLLSTNTWTKSQAEAVSMGGNLVTINDQAEHEWVYETFSYWEGQSRSLWIGLTDKDEEGVFKWVTGEPLTFTNWCEGEPNNHEENEHYVHIFEPDDHLGRGGTWNDSGDLLFFDDYEIHGVVEIVPASDPTPVSVSIERAVAIQWKSEFNKSYQVQRTTDLANGPWVNFGGVVAGSGSTNSVFDLADPVHPRFYRIIQLP